MGLHPTAQNTVASSVSDVIYLAGSEGEGVYAVGIGEGSIIGRARTALFNNSRLAWNEKREELYVAASNGNTVSVVKLDPLREVATIGGDVGWNTHSMAADPVTDMIYLSCSQGGKGPTYRRVVALDATAKGRSSRVDLDATWGTSFLALSPNGERLYVSWDAHLDIYSTPNLRLVGRYTHSGWTSNPIVASRDSRSVYMVQQRELVRWSTNLHRAEKTMTLPGEDSYHVQSSDGQRIWVCGFRHIYEMRRSVEGFRVIQPPQHSYYSRLRVAESTNGRTLYVLADVGAGTCSISVVDLATGQVIKVIAGVPNAGISDMVVVPRL